MEEENAVFFLLSDREGKIVDSNQFTRSLLGGDPRGGSLRDVFVDFKRNLNPDAFSREPARERLLNLNTCTGIPQSLYIRFFSIEGHVMMLGRLDIIELENLRKRLLDMNNELNDLTRRLHKQNAELARLNDLKNHFLGMAAHDLRNPAGIVQMLAEILIDEAGSGLGGEHRELLEDILASGRSMSRIINDFLDTAKIESGRFEVELLPGDMGEIVDAAVKWNTIIARKRGLTITHDRTDTILPVEVDRNKIQQVLNNLIQNAVDYSPDGGVVRLRVDKERERIRVTISDQGPGIPPDVKKTLFQPFGKGSARKRSGDAGTGLGLAISKKIIDAHGGEIGVDSSDGAGSRFYFRLPLSDPPDGGKS